MKLSNTPASRRKSPSAEPAVSPLLRIVKEGMLIGLAVLCLYLLLAMFSYDMNDQAWSSTGGKDEIQNLGGRFGANIADISFYFFGYLAYLFPVMLAYRAWQVFRERTYQQEFDWLLIGLRCVGLVLVMVAGTAIATMHYSSGEFVLSNSNGGLLGRGISEQVEYAFGYTGGTLLLLATFLIGMTVFTDLSWFAVMDELGRMTLAAISKVKEWWLQYRRARHERQLADSAQQHRREVVAQHAKVEAKRIPPVITEPLKKVTAPSPRAQKEKQVSLFETIDPAIAGTLPALGLLDPADKRSDKGYSKESLEAMSKLLELKLKDFSIDIDVVSVQPGPVVTRFEIQPAPGIKASRISGLAKDLARSLAVISVRVVEVIPGKSVMGIEIPNVHREIVRLSEVISSEAYENSRSSLTIALGHDISGEPIVADLAKMPHLLVAGTTGSGKSVGVNVMLLSLLYKSSPHEVRLMLVDPKMLELSVYEGIPHLLTPVITDMKDAANGLRWCVGEMERRYKLMAALGVRNLAGFNRKLEDAIKAGNPILDPLFKPEDHYEAGEAVATAPALESLPAIVVVIDEFADMMMIVGKKVEQLIARIAQKARAAGIHLILATQRPSVDVITGLIKANVPTRMAFQVSSKIDSRTILDQGGAEQLLGHGDMLYLPPGTSLPVRVHGAFVDDHEVHRVVADWKKRGQPNYIDGITDDSNNSIPVPGMTSEGEDGDGNESDVLYDEAVSFVLETRKASISSVQRKLRIGYNRAARLIESMEAAGVVSAAGHNGNREVLVPER